MAGANTEPALSYQGSAAVIANRFVKLTGDQTVATADTAGAYSPGVANSDISTSNVNGTNEVTVGKVIGVWDEGVVWVEAGAAITRGVEVATDNVGRAVAAVSTNNVLGRCLRGTDAAGKLALVEINAVPYIKP